MQYRQLGRTNLSVSLLGLGTGGANQLGQAQQTDQQQATHLVRHALDLGINLIDTAPGYGTSEALLGEALRGVRRDSYIMCTKFSANRRGTPQPAGALRASLQASLRALQTDYVDLLYFHGLSPTTYDATMDRFLGELQQAQQDGLTRFIGATEMYEVDPSHDALGRALDDDLFDVLMIGHNLISPGGLTRIMPMAQAKQVALVVMCAVRTILTNPEMLRETIRQWTEDGALAAGAVAADAPLDWVLGPGVTTIAEAAYLFAAESPAVSSVLTGTADPAHLDANVEAILGPPLPAEISARLRDIFIPANRSVLLHNFVHR
jgi:L-galactose dehydrogenase